MVQRNTIQKALVMEAVNALQCHATADEVYRFIRRTHPNISKATVYRNLNQLAEHGAVRKIEIAGGNDRFDHICADHYHVICQSCGRVFDVDMDVIPGLTENIRDAHGFAFSSYDIVFRGICPECRRAKESDDYGVDP